MNETNEQTNNGVSSSTNGELSHDFISSFRLIVLAALRNKQLLRGAKPRIEVNPLKRRSTSIAVEEVKLGLVSFKLLSPDQMIKIRSVDKVDKPWGNARV
jgi:DNA-directed RNA polymerase omega subunit